MSSRRLTEKEAYALLGIKSKKENKYHAEKTAFGENKFDSQKEAGRYAELCLLLRAKEISELRTQVRYELIPKQEGERAVYYVADFVYKDKQGNIVVEDTKSEATRTPVYVVKRKLMQYVHGIKVREL